MLTYDDALNLNYYKKTSFTGWMNGMRFLIRRESPEDGEPIFHAWVWQGPRIFDLTPGEKKLEHTAPFTEEGKKDIVDWINRQYVDHPDLWSHEGKPMYES